MIYELEGSLKGQTRRKRTKGCNPIKYKISDTMDMKNSPMISLLSHIETKSKLTFFLKDKVLQYYSSSNKRIITYVARKLQVTCSMIHNHEEADTYATSLFGRSFNLPGMYYLCSLS